MKLRLRGAGETGRLAGELSQRLADDPLFCLYCPDPARRQKFAYAYFRYYLRFWAGRGRAYISADRSAVAVLTPRDALLQKPHGPGALRLRLADPAAFRSMCAHHKEVAALMQVVLPAGRPVCNLRVFAPSGGAAAETVGEALGFARLKNLSVTYETTSSRFVDAFLKTGFRLGYQNPVVGRREMQTVLFADFSSAGQV